MFDYSKEVNKIYKGRTIRAIQLDNDSIDAEIKIYFTDGSSLTFYSPDLLDIRSPELDEIKEKERARVEAERRRAEFKRDATLRAKYPGIT